MKFMTLNLNMMKKISIIILSFSFISNALCESKIAEYKFNEYVVSINKHAKILSLDFERLAIEEMGKIRGSWGDPKFQIAAVNFPKDSLKDDETPMTGIKYSIMQKISLTNRYGNIKDAFHLASQAKLLELENKKSLFIKTIWLLSIEKRKFLSDLKILKENKDWIENMLKVSKRLYSTGKISQQALLDIQIRKSKIQIMIKNKEVDLQRVDSRLSYFIDEEKSDKVSIHLASVPWELLNKKGNQNDHLEESLKKKIKSKKMILLSKKKNFFPDLTIGLSYTKRSSIDNKGDFVGASITFPLPISGKKYGDYRKILNEKLKVDRVYRNYQLEKKKNRDLLTLEIHKTSSELSIIQKNIKNYAKDSREIMTKSYSLGKSSYFELLKSELQLQEVLLKENQLISHLDKNKIEKKYIEGDLLHETID